jgi:uncharacterized protein (DUF486 family)
MSLLIISGLLVGVAGASLWPLLVKEPRVWLTIRSIPSIVLLLVSMVLIVLGFNKQFLMATKNKISPWMKNVAYKRRAWVYTLSLIFISAVMYTLAAYYHTDIANWTFPMALCIAIPFVLIEYQFSLRGNYYARNVLNLNTVQIAIITMVFYFICTWILNAVRKRQPVKWWREVLAFALIVGALLCTTMIK